MSTNDPGDSKALAKIQGQLSKLIETVSELASAVAGFPVDVRTLGDADERHTKEIRDLQRRVQILENAPDTRHQED